MKYVITCPFCNNTFTVDGEQTKEFICPTCGGPANPDNAVSAHDTEMEEAQRKISINFSVRFKNVFNCIDGRAVFNRAF